MWGVWINHCEDPYEPTRIQWKVSDVSKWGVCACVFWGGGFDSESGWLVLPYVQVQVLPRGPSKLLAACAAPFSGMWRYQQVQQGNGGCWCVRMRMMVQTLSLHRCHAGQASLDTYRAGCGWSCSWWAWLSGWIPNMIALICLLVSAQSVSRTFVEV